MSSLESLPANEISRITHSQFIIDSCAICGSTHRHGRVPRDLAVGEETTRGAHCDGEHREYRLQRTAETEVDQ